MFDLRIELIVNLFETFVCQWHKPKRTPIKSERMNRLRNMEYIKYIMERRTCNRIA